MYYRAGWLSLAICVLAFGYAGAQTAYESQRISWHFSSLKQSESEWKLLFTAVIDPGWHLYSQSTPADGPMPVLFRFSKAAEFRLLGDVKENGVMKKSYDPVFMVNVLWYENSVVFSQVVKVTGKGGKRKVTGEIDFAVCSGEMCEPRTARFSLDVGE